MPDLVQAIIQIYGHYQIGSTKVFVESVAFQKGIAQMLQHENVPAEEITIGGQDKRTRLSLTSNLIKKGQLIFPATGAEKLIQQIIYFGTERYDDLVDALTLIVNEIISIDIRPSQTAMFIPWNDMRPKAPHEIIYSYSTGRDWADEDDEEIFKKLRGRRRY